MNKPKFNIDAHAYWLLREGQQVEVDGQKIQLTIVEEAKKTINLHTDSWAVLNDGSQRFKDTVVKWLQENKDSVLTGELYGHFYGVDTSGKDNNWKRKDYFTHILTINEFCAIAYPEKEKGSELVGKWFRCLESHEPIFTSNKWYQCLKPINEEQAFSTNHDNLSDGCQGRNHQLFDLLNPLDYNPETLIGKYWNGNKIESIYFDEDKAMIPRFKFNNGLAVLCKITTPSDVTDTPLVKSLKYEDCFERVKPQFYADVECVISKTHGAFYDNVPTERQAKQLAATIKLMTIAYDANGGEWVPSEQELIVTPVFVRRYKQCTFDPLEYSAYSPIYFRDYETAKRAYEANKEIFHDYFGIGGENE